ncbi:MAG TPA: hypothetical protein VFZ65_01270 [Planctomycetota bacterium]|nr:hypothetical protein [Planctomycetota bacterium]
MVAVGRPVRVSLAFTDHIGEPHISYCRGVDRASGRRPEFQFAGSVATCADAGDWNQLGIEVRGHDFESTVFLVARGDVGPDGTVEHAVLPTGRLVLTLLDATTREPVANTKVVVRPQRDGLQFPFSDTEGTSDPSGVIVHPALGIGSYALQVASGELGIVEPSSCEVPRAGAQVEVLVARSGFGVAGRVVGRGAPVPDARVSFRNQVVATTDREGLFAIPASCRPRDSGPAIFFRVDPPPDAGLSSDSRCGPFAWGDRRVVVELLPARHVLEVAGLPAGGSQWACWFYRHRGGFQQKDVQWEALPNVAWGRFSIAWDTDWDHLVSLKLLDGSGSPPRFSEIQALPARVEDDCVVHHWQLPQQVPRTIEVVDEAGAAIAGVAAEAIYTGSVANPPNAQATPAFDPATSNPMTANKALLLATAETDAAGRCSLSFAAAPGVYVRLHHRDHVAVAHRLTEADGAVIRIAMQGAGSVHGVVEGLGNARVLLAPEGRGRVGARRASNGVFVASDLPAGRYHVVMPLAEADPCPRFDLGVVDVEAGRQAEFAGSIVGLAVLAVHVHSEDLHSGDQLTIVDDLTGHSAARVAFTGIDGATANLTPGRYRVVVARNLPAGGGKLSLQANELLRVHSGSRDFRLTLPTEPARWRLFAAGAPLRNAWVRVREVGLDARTDDQGWLSHPVCELGCTVELLENVRGNWRLAGVEWALSRAQSGQDVAARE